MKRTLLKKNLIDNPRTNSDVLKILANDPNEYVREHLARNQSINLEVQEILVKASDLKSSNPGLFSQNHNVKSNLANNPSIHSKIQEILVNDKSWYIRCSLARNPFINLDIQEKLAYDDVWMVAFTLAKNKSIGDFIQKILKNNKKVMDELIEENEYSKSNFYHRLPISLLLDLPNLIMLDP